MNEPIPHKAKIAIVMRLVKPETMREKGAFGRELKLLNQLLPRYPLADFWFSLNLGYTLNSLAFFKMPEGAATLAAAHRAYQFEVAQKALDSANKSRTLTDTATLVAEPVAPLPPRKTAISWIDATLAPH